MTGEIHVYPLEDEIEHETDGDGAACPCGPTVETVFRDDGSTGFVVVHHALDAREI